MYKTAAFVSGLVGLDHSLNPPLPALAATSLFGKSEDLRAQGVQNPSHTVALGPPNWQRHGKCWSGLYLWQSILFWK